MYTFKVKFSAKGGQNEEIKLVIFDDLMTTLIGKTAAELKLEVSKLLEPGEDDTFIFPEDFRSLVAKDFCVRCVLPRRGKTFFSTPESRVRQCQFWYARVVVSNFSTLFQHPSQF